MEKAPFEMGTPEKANCLLGDKGKSRNVPLCDQRKSCIGCGWDKTEHRRRISLIRSKGLTPISEFQKNKLRTVYGADISGELISAHIRKPNVPPTESE